jgi:hypothetical protein
VASHTVAYAGVNARIFIVDLADGDTVYDVPHGGPGLAATPGGFLPILSRISGGPAFACECAQPSGPTYIRITKLAGVGTNRRLFLFCAMSGGYNYLS